MDPRWLPWCWAVGAVGCAMAFAAVQPWRPEWASGWRLVRKYPASWLIPAGLVACDTALEKLQGTLTGAAAQESVPSVAQALAEAWQGIHFGTGAAWVGALLLASNACGIRRGLLKGIVSVTGTAGQAWLAVLLTGAVALGTDAILTGYGMPAVWQAALLALAIPLVGWVSAAVLAGLLLLAETAVRAPEKVQGVRWLETAAAHSVRLWPWALGHGLLWWLGRGVPDWAGGYVRILLAVTALGLAFAPLVFLHVKDTAGARDGAGTAAGLWRTHGWQPWAWLAAAILIFYSWDLAGQALATAPATLPGWLRIALAPGHRLVQIGLTVMSLAAWVGFRLAGLPPPKRPRRPRG